MDRNGAWVFYPMYENHLSGINPESIPKETDVFFCEGNVDRLHAPVVEKLKEDDILLMYETIHENGWRDLGEVGVAAGTFLAEVFGGGYMLKKAFKKDSKPLTNRRKVLKVGAGFAGLWGTSLVAVPLLAMSSISLNPDGDSRLWTADELEVPALYASSLLVAPEHKGNQIGAKLLDWAEKKAHAEGKKWIRLDCWTTNSKLHAYYKEHGFSHVRTILDRKSGALFQRSTA